MNILGPGIDGELPRFKILPQAGQFRVQSGGGIRRDYPLPSQHGRVDPAPGNVLPGKAAIHRNGGLEGKGLGPGFFRKPSSPEKTGGAPLFIPMVFQENNPPFR
jgi:hypothetical protein